MGDIQHNYGQITPRNEGKHDELIRIELWVRVYYRERYYYVIKELMKVFIRIAQELFKLTSND